MSSFSMSLNEKLCSFILEQTLQGSAGFRGVLIRPLRHLN